MINYETLMLARTEITDDELGALERQIDKIVTDRKGRMTLFDRWGKHKLAYAIKKNTYGIYILTRYQAPADQVASLFKEIDLLFRIKFNEIILRHVTVKLFGDVTLDYKRPESISSRSTGSLDSFIKENKMKGLIDASVENTEEPEFYVDEDIEEVVLGDEKRTEEN